MSDVYEIKQPSELLITINALQSEIKLSKEDAQVILGYMQGHDFMLTLDDGKLMRVDISEENGQRVPYTMDEVIDLVCEWNYEQLEEARAVVEEMYQELCGIITSLKEPHLKQLAENTFINDTAFVKEFKVHSAAKAVHHGFVGGLLQHTLAVTRLCDFMAANYSVLDRDLLLTAAIFHDFAKVYEISNFPMNDYTDDGQLLGHIFMGAEKIGQKIQEVPGFPPVLASELRHCILSHHGELEFGSPKKPALAEAIALSFADNTDAKLETITEIYDKAEPTTEWLGFSRYVDSNVRQSSGYVQKKKGNKI